MLLVVYLAIVKGNGGKGRDLIFNAFLGECISLSSFSFLNYFFALTLLKLDYIIIADCSYVNLVVSLLYGYIYSIILNS